MKRQALIFATLCAFLAGCATPLKPNQIKVDINSEPPGAMIYDGDKAWGTTPISFVLSANESELRAGYKETSKVYAMWPSGAKSRNGIRIYLGQGAQQFTFSRPSDAPGLGIDLAYAAQLRQIAASESAAFWQSVNYMQANTPQPKSPTYTDCRKSGSGVNCTTW